MPDPAHHLPRVRDFFLLLRLFFGLGGTGRFGSASGLVKNMGYSFITNEATGFLEQYIEFQFNVCVPPPNNTNPTPPGPPKKSGKTSKPSF